MIEEDFAPNTDNLSNTEGKGESFVGVETVGWQFLAQRIGLGALLGLAVGYTAKKALKVVLVIVAVLLLVLLLLQHYDFIQINWHIIEGMYQETLQHEGGIIGRFSDWASRLGDMLPVAGSFVVGFLIGFKLG